MDLLVVFLLLCSAADSAKILAFFHSPSVSHQFVFQSIVKELSLRGHEVTFATTDPINDSELKNLTEVDMSVSYQIFRETDASVFSRESTSLIKMSLIGQEFMEKIVSMQMELEGVKEILKKPENSYDLIIIEALNPFFFGLQHKFKAPLVAVSSFGLITSLHKCFGNTIHPILYPDLMSGILGPLNNIWDKFDSLYINLVLNAFSEFHTFPRFDKQARSHFGNDMPSLKELVKETSLVFANVNPLFSDRRPMVPNVIYVWNIHLDRNKTLPAEFQNILDNAKNGAVYFSLGTNVRFDHVKGDIKKTILDALGELPYTVLCKWETENVTGSPKNVVLKKWFPQQPILAHPNIRAFVTQGGLQSSEEAITNGVPLVVIPFLGDQPMNAKILTSHGMAETIAPKDLNKDLLRDTILKVAKDDKYRLKAQELRSIFLDQPQSGVEKIIWWCEYVIRHKGAKHLRSPGADISLWEYFMLDVLAVVLLAAVVSYMIVKRLVQLILRIFKRESRSVKGSDKKIKQKKN